MGGLDLTPDGMALGAVVDRKWRGNASRFLFCGLEDEDAACTVCTPKGPAPATGKPCGGTPRSCSSNSPGSCARIWGCSMRSRRRYNGTYENSCEGSPDRCDSIIGEEQCREQGCEWGG